MARYPHRRCERASRALLVSGLLAWLCQGCGTFVTVTPLRGAAAAQPGRPPESVEILASGPPARAHVDIALLEVEQTESWNRQGTDLMLQRLQKAASRLGCDAVVIIGKSERTNDPDVFFDSASHSLLASCVVYTGESGVAPVAAAPNGDAPGSPSDGDPTPRSTAD
jgi:hypothetical protein